MVPGSVDSTSDNPLETRNLALNSTFVVQGSCVGVVFAIGDKTVMGRIVAMSVNILYISFTFFLFTHSQKRARPSSNSQPYKGRFGSSLKSSPA